jgi:hypothetical protein
MFNSQSKCLCSLLYLQSSPNFTLLQIILNGIKHCGRPRVGTPTPHPLVTAGVAIFCRFVWETRD